MENKNDKYIGALWLKRAKSGLVFMSGLVEIEGVEHNIVVFKNNRKVKDKQPDYQILKSEPYKKQEKSDDFIPEEMPIIDNEVEDINATLQYDIPSKNN